MWILTTLYPHSRGQHPQATWTPTAERMTHRTTCQRRGAEPCDRFRVKEFGGFVTRPIVALAWADTFTEVRRGPAESGVVVTQFVTQLAWPGAMTT